MSDERAETDASDPSEQSPRADFFTLAGVAAALGTSTTLGLKAYELLNPKDPFIVQIVDSYSNKDTYVVDLEAKNSDFHALYIEQIKLKEPFEFELMAVEKIGKDGSFDLRKSPENETFPQRIKSGESRKMRLILKLPNPPKKAQYGIAEFEIARLGEKSGETKEVRFLIRGS